MRRVYGSRGCAASQEVVSAARALKRVLAEFERSRIAERVTAGLARARAQGKRLGRPRSRPLPHGVPATLTVAFHESDRLADDAAQEVVPYLDGSVHVAGAGAW